MHVSKVILFSILALASNATASASDPKRSMADEMPEKWQYVSEFNQTLPPDDQWWKSFNDPMLDSLIAEGVNNNFNVLMAIRRIEIARQNIRQARSAFFPSINASAGWTKNRNSGLTTRNEIDATTIDYFSLGVDMNWEIDIFGKVAAGVKERKAQWQASRAEYAATMVSLCSEIASTYIQLRAYQAELKVTRHHLEQQKKVLDIVEARHEATLNSELDVAQSKSIYYSTTAAIIPIETSISSAINALAVLTGTYPEQMSQRLADAAPLPDYKKIISVGVPMQLLRRRPDILQAEYDLSAYAAALGIAKKDFLPTLSLTGSIGTAAHDASDLFKDKSLTYAIAPKLTWTIFDGMARKASVAAARQQMEAGIDNYNMTLLTAIQEVDNAMTAYVNASRYIDILKQTLQQSERFYEVSLIQYTEGLTQYTPVADAQIDMLQYANQAVTAHCQALTALIDIYKSLGGGWEIDGNIPSAQTDNKTTQR